MASVSSSRGTGIFLSSKGTGKRSLKTKYNVVVNRGPEWHDHVCSKADSVMKNYHIPAVPSLLRRKFDSGVRSADSSDFQFLSSSFSPGVLKGSPRESTNYFSDDTFRKCRRPMERAREFLAPCEAGADYLQDPEGVVGDDIVDFSHSLENGPGTTHKLLNLVESKGRGSADENGEDGGHGDQIESQGNDIPTSQVDASEGVKISLLLFFLLGASLLAVDAYIWRVVRRPLASFFLTLPFILSTACTFYLGAVCVPLLRRLQVRHVSREEGPQGHLYKSGTPTMGGGFFIPVGLLVARFAIGFPARELTGVALVTLAFAAIGFLDDGLAVLRRHNYGLPATLKAALQVLVGLAFYYWMNGTDLPSPYNMKLLVPLPSPLGLWYMGALYLPLSTFTFAAMSNGANLTDGLDGLAAGTAAIAFVGMAIAVLPIYPSLGVYGVSMAGACFGFLGHNRYKADVFMGDTGSLALGGGLAAMACCTGMFLPLFLTAIWMVIEAVSVICQVSYFKLTKKLTGKGKRWLKMSPFHHHLEMSGWSEPKVVMLAYLVTLVFSVAGAYLGLVSA